MKYQISLFLPLFIAFPIYAQDSKEPIILPEAFAQKVNPNGTDVMAQDISGSAIVYNIASGEALWYGGFYPGNGNSLANNGMLVGQDMQTSRAAVMINGEGVVPKPLSTVLQSSFDAITPDGSRVCGWIQNAGGGPMQIPFYCDISEDGSIGNPVALPYPSKDFFNDTPQFCTAAYISDDGKTIAGILQDGTGFYSYPIVYRQDLDGKWSYTCPSESLFNLDHLEIPKYPDLDNLDYPSQPQITDFMTPEMKEEFEKAMAKYEETGNSNDNPWSDINHYTGEEGYMKFEQAIVAYNREVNEIISKVMDTYWKEMAKVGKYARFIPNMALSPDGTILIADLGLSEDEYTSDTSSGYVTYKFDLSSSSFTTIESQYPDLIPLQILENGSYVAVASPSSLMGYNSYILMEGEKEYISFSEYIAKTNPEYSSWFSENLDIFGTGVISGIVSFSKDMSVIVGGVPYDNLLSYIIYGANVANVDTIINPETDSYNVFSINGIKLLSTKNKNDLHNLPKGLYIINDKKIKL